MSLPVKIDIAIADPIEPRVSTSRWRGRIRVISWSIAIAQVNLRSKVGALELIYIEYFYFILYSAILGVAANAITFTLKGSGVAQVGDNLIPKLLFWPAILGACMAVTLIFLY